MKAEDLTKALEVLKAKGYTIVEEEMHEMDHLELRGTDNLVCHNTFVNTPACWGVLLPKDAKKQRLVVMQSPF